MLRQAHAYGHAQSPAIIATPHAEPRGMPGHALSWRDLVEFGRCPWRWVGAPDPEDLLAANGPSLSEWLAFTPGLAQSYFVRRPETYEAMKLLCPKCNSEGPAKSCTKCGQRRRNVIVPRPWTSAAKWCAQWQADKENKKLRIVTPAEYDRAKSAAESLQADNVIKELLPDCDGFCVVSGTWEDAASKLAIPVWSLVSLVPREGSAMDHAIVTVLEARNADPAVWESWVYSTGAHIRAALALDLWNKAADDTRREHLWIVIERDEPRLVARRRASPELLAEGRKRLEELLRAYAACLVLGKWPRFEGENPAGLDSWAPVNIQPWMTSGAGPHGGYYAPTAVFAPGPEPAHHAAGT